MSIYAKTFEERVDDACQPTEPKQKKITRAVNEAVKHLEALALIEMDQVNGCKENSRDTIGYHCTRPKGHEGLHIACGAYDCYLVWED